MAKIKIDKTLEEMLTPKPKEPSKPDKESKSKKDKLAQAYNQIAFRLSYMRDPATIYGSEELTIHYHKMIASVVADATGSTIEQVLNKNTRTEEQDELLLAAAGQLQMYNLNRLLNSAYVQAVSYITEALKGQTKYPDEDMEVAREAAIYFFAIHEDIPAQESTPLTAEQQEELLGIYKRLDAFYIEKIGTRPTRNIEENYEILNAFIAADNPEEEAQIMRNVPAVIATTPDKFTYPLDKLNNNVWRDLEKFPRNKDGQLAFRTGRDDKSPAAVIYNIKFDELEGVKLTKKLTQYDKIVYVAVHAVYRHTGGMIMSAGQIYAAMGNAGKKPSARDIQLINDSLTKMGAARIFIDNIPELQVHKRAERFSYDAPLLPFERITATINNAVTTNAIRLYAEPPLMTFALQRKQVTTIDSSLLDMPLSKTDQNLRLWDYFVEQISHMKNSKGKFNNKMLLETICEKCEIKTSKQRSRAIPKIEKLLRHFMKHDPPFIKSYKMLEDGVEIFY
jgi:hypothetical protein